MNICRTCSRAASDETRTLVIETLKHAQADLAAVNFDPEAMRRCDPHSMPATIGSVRSRVNRALDLLMGLI